VAGGCSPPGTTGRFGRLDAAVANAGGRPHSRGPPGAIPPL